jgi:hypothetical protein
VAQWRKEIREIRHDVSGAGLLASAAVAWTIFGGPPISSFAVSRWGLHCMQLQSRSLAVKARRIQISKLLPCFEGHHHSDEVYLAIVLAVFWARQHAGRASILRRDECKPQFSTAFPGPQRYPTPHGLRPSSPGISHYVDKRRFFRRKGIFQCLP